MEDKEGNRESNITSILSALPHDQWAVVHSSGWRPSARYEHAAEVVHDKLYVVGGSRNGRYLSDIQVFDLRSLKWSLLSPSESPKPQSRTSEGVLPAIAGHSLVKWENKLLIVAGHSRESKDTVTVWSFDLEMQYCSIVKTFGKIPTARGGQSVTLVGSRLVMFGGEDSKRGLLNDLHILDLESMTWDIVEAKTTSPAPRFDHTAALHADQYLLVFGGSSHSTCFSDLHILDLQNMEWSQPETQGVGVSPRGGHAGATVDDKWYIVGGGDNKNGATETIVLSMLNLVWSVPTHVKIRDPIASEGISLCTATIDGDKFLVAFGGYNGKYNNEVFILKPKPRNIIQPRLFQSPAAAAAAASVTAAYALTASGGRATDHIYTEDAISTTTQVESLPKVSAPDTDAMRTENKMLESKLVEVRDENTRLKGNLDELNNTFSELSMELQSIRGQLASESSRCFKLEVQIADMHKKLDSLSSIEHELESLRQQKSKAEQDMVVPERQHSGGVWQWVTGSA